MVGFGNSGPGDDDERATETLTQELRYSRQILFSGIGAAGQGKLRASHVAVVGVGGTGAAAASMLARAGVGTLTLIDRDVVEFSNLQRQVLYDEADARQALPKAEAARKQIARFNSDTTIYPHVVDLVPANVHDLLAPATLVLDGTDNFETRYLLNDYAIEQGKPWIYAAGVGAYAATMDILPVGSIGVPTACLACLFPAPPGGGVETCDTAGILSSAVTLAASIQVTEALKILTGQPELLRRTLLSFNLWTGEHAELDASTPDPECRVCIKRDFLHLGGDDRPHITLCGRNSVQIHERRRPLDLAALHNALAAHPEITELRRSPLLLRFRRNAHTLTVFSDGRALIQGTTDIPTARSLYARFIGS